MNRRGTTIRFKPDPEIFHDLQFSPARLYRFCRSKAYLFRGVEIRWACDPALLRGGKDETPARGGAAFSGRLARQPGGRDRRFRARASADLGGRGRSAGRGAARSRMGGRLARRGRGVPPFLLQHDPDAAGRHA